jgi:DNA polymerase delta subunit 3
LLSGPLLSTSTLAQTQLPSDGPKLDAKALAAIEASQRVKIRDMDEVSDGERNSEDESDGDDELMTNDKGKPPSGGGR